MKQLRQTYREMIIAIAVQCLVYCVAGALLVRQYIIFPLSVMAGGAVAAAVLTHMRKSVTVITELEPGKAKKYGAGQAVIRMLMMGLALCVSAYYAEYINPWGVLLGMASLKFSAYMQPLVHGMLNKAGDRKGRKEG